MADGTRYGKHLREVCDRHDALPEREQRSVRRRRKNLATSPSKSKDSGTGKKRG